MKQNLDKSWTKQMVAVTNRHLCCLDYYEQIQRVVALHPKMLVLREKDLSAEEYTECATRVKQICGIAGVQLVLHRYIEAAEKLQHAAIHLPLNVLRQLRENGDRRLEQISCLGTSTHSVEDAIEAASLGASYIFAGNIYETDCKKGLPGRGLTFLQEVVMAVDVPVYAIGGVDQDKLQEILKTGAAGGCMMSGFMNL